MGDKKGCPCSFGTASLIIHFLVYGVKVRSFDKQVPPPPSCAQSLMVILMEFPVGLYPNWPGTLMMYDSSPGARSDWVTPATHPAYSVKTLLEWLITNPVTVSLPVICSYCQMEPPVFLTNNLKAYWIPQVSNPT